MAWIAALTLVIAVTGFHVFADRNAGLKLSAPAGSVAREQELNSVEADTERTNRSAYSSQLLDNTSLDADALSAFTGGKND